MGARVGEQTGSRREFLLGAGGAVGSAWLAAHWPAIAAAQAHAAGQVHAHHAVESPPGPDRLEFLTPAEAADVDAIAAQIVPTDDLPGAREAGVVWFLDRSLRTWAAPMAAPFREQLHAFQSRFAAAHGGLAFAAATHAEQFAHLQSIEREPFFGQMRFATLLGMFSHPSYGGNRGGVGWRLIGFEDRHGFSPPFGWYDRDYPGFGREPRS